jgi:hypothetical protein
VLDCCIIDGTRSKDVGNVLAVASVGRSVLVFVITSGSPICGERYHAIPLPH